MIDRNYSYSPGSGSSTGDLELQRRELMQAYYDVFSSESGKKVLSDLERQCCTNFLTIYGSNMSLTDMLYIEGSRYIGNYIKHQIKQYEEEFINGKRD